ncbi:hypothetical protein [Desulfobacter sp.]|uniref:hypothetical protein n=1 Tax=Desulfobacter sp. TaxID=2294 RepID=UPI003D0CBC67
MNNIDIKSLYGLKYNPFLPNIPEEALYRLPGSETFELRIRSMAQQGGFALITGEPGLGKSKTLHKMACNLEKVPDLAVGVMFTVLCGDNRLPERFRSPELLPLGSRIGPRLVLEPLTPDQLQDYLHFALDQAGNSQLMTDALIRTLAGHAANNLRILNQMAAELLNAAAVKELPKIDESLFFQLFSPSRSRPKQN